MPPDILREVKLLRYRERMGGLTDAEARQEPNAVIEHAFIVWGLDATRAKLEERKRNI